MRKINEFNKLTKKELQELYKEKGNAPKVAKIYNISEATVRKKLKLLNIPINKAGVHLRGKVAGNRAVLAGKVFGKLKVIKYSHSVRNKGNNIKALWECICKCGNKCFAATHSLNFGLVKSCGCIRKKLAEGNIAIGDLSTSYFNRIKNGAKCRGICFEITSKEIWNLFLLQDKKCAYSGLAI